MDRGCQDSKKPSVLYLILAHHPPSRIHRTVQVRVGRFQQPVCARCLGQFISVLILLPILLLTGFNVSMPYWLVITGLCPIPAIVDWTTQTVGHRESTNWLRILTGSMYGVSVALGLTSAIRMEFHNLGFLSLVLLVYMIVITIIMKRAGVIDTYLKIYENFVAQRHHYYQQR